MEDLKKKCDACNLNQDNDIMESCKRMVEVACENKEKLDLSVEESETYLKMVENLKPKDVSKILTLALKIRESGDIKDTELKNSASVLIRSIEMS
ncbi:MAG: hypothetical protein ACRCVG_01515 [Methanobacteriaceae archaeon]